MSGQSRNALARGESLALTAAVITRHTSGVLGQRTPVILVVAPQGAVKRLGDAKAPLPVPAYT